MSWESIHLFIHSYPLIDKFLEDDFYHFMRKQRHRITAFFFIRYWLGGPHIRLRYQLADGVSQADFLSDVSHMLDTFIEKYHTEYPLMPPEMFNHRTLVENEAIEQPLFVSRHGEIREISYDREFDRYGGDQIQLSENIFVASSELAMELNRLSFGKRVLAALDLMYYSARLGNETAWKAFHDYEKIWQGYEETEFDIKQYLPLLTARLKKNMANPEPPPAYRDYLKSLENNLAQKRLPADYRQAILYSHIHMTNNRIGVTPVYEMHLSRFLKDALANAQEVSDE